MTTAADLIDTVRQYVFSGQRETMNVLTNAQTDTDTSFTFSYDLGPLQVGSYIAIDLEIVYVWSVAIQNKTVVVQRGMLGSTAASHSAGALAYVNSKFPAFSIFQALNADLDDLCSPTNGLYQTVNKDFTYNPAIQGYDLGVTGDVIDILAVRCQVPGPSNDWVTLHAYRLELNAETSSFASGVGIILYEPASAGLTVRVTYSSSLTHLTSLTSTVASTGLQASASDLPPIGAAMRLAGVREVKRNFDESQGDTRRASEVPPNAQIAGYQLLARERARRIKAESDKLASSWPAMRLGI